MREMSMKHAVLAGSFIVATGIVVAAVLLATSFAPVPPVPVRAAEIPPGEVDPTAWGRAYPLHLDGWKATERPKRAGSSRYKRGLDDDGIVWDKLSEYPYMALLFHGFGFGHEYNEPQGHMHMMRDIQEIDASRHASGGACLTCKSPHVERLHREHPADYFNLTLPELVLRIPEGHRMLGVACSDCHDAATLDLAVNRWTIRQGLGKIGRPAPSRLEMRSVVCGQCHCTYSMLKDPAGKVVDVSFPWGGSAFGGITIENIIRELREDPRRLEWKQAVTGFKLGYIRHPEFEFYTAGSVHWRGGVSCADCHMPYTRVGSNKISDHDVTSPLKNDLKACLHCHVESAAELRGQVLALQDRHMALLHRSGYATATAAKLFERANAAAAAGTPVDADLYGRAKEAYLEAFYRVVFLGAENSTGFHNPSEGGRVAADAVAFAGRAEALLRQGLAGAGVETPADVPLELARYLNGRGTGAKAGTLDFKPEQEFGDPSGVGARLHPPGVTGLPAAEGGR